MTAKLAFAEPFRKSLSSTSYAHSLGTFRVFNFLRNGGKIREIHEN